MSVLYCTIPHFCAALARRDRPTRGWPTRGGPTAEDRPLVLIDPEGRVLDAAPEAAACGVVAGLTARLALVRCPQARLVEADVARCRQEREVLLQVLERVGPNVEPHGWGAAYVDLGDLARDRPQAEALCVDIGRAIRSELGKPLQPALGWDSGKFTAHAAARRTQPGRLLAVPADRERAFLGPLPATLLPLAGEAHRRLGFLGLRTIGQYASLPPAAVWEQFGRAGRLAQRCARGQDDRPIVARGQAECLTAEVEFETPLALQERLLAALKSLIAPLISDLAARLRACGQIRLTVQYDDGQTQERARAFLLATADASAILRALEQLVGKLSWPAPATALAVRLEQIEDVVIEQLTFFPAEDERERQRHRRLREAQRYLAARFGANCLRRAALLQPGAPLPEWRVGWIDAPNVPSGEGPDEGDS
jgi:protein ImuB